MSCVVHTQWPGAAASTAAGGGWGTVQSKMWSHCKGAAYIRTMAATVQLWMHPRHRQCSRL